MTTPRDDISGLSERLREWLGHVHSLKSRLSSRSRSEIFYPGSLAPELLRRSEEMLGEVVEHGREAYDAIDALQARVKELEAECFRLAADTCHAGYGDEHGHHRCREVDQANARALRAEQERDEAYERAAKIIDAECECILSKQTPTNDPLSMEDAVNQNLRLIAFILPDIAAAIRRLAGPEKEGK